MKKLLFIFTLAAICTIATSSFKSVQSANGHVLQTISVASVNTGDFLEEGKKDNKKKKQTTTSSCCQSRAQKPECTQAQQKSCAASKVACPAEKKSEKK